MTAYSLHRHEGVDRRSFKHVEWSRPDERAAHLVAQHGCGALLHLAQKGLERRVELAVGIDEGYRSRARRGRGCCADPRRSSSGPGRRPDPGRHGFQLLRGLVAGLGVALAIPSGAAVALPSETSGDTAPTSHSRQCVTGDGQPCKTAKEYKRAFVRGDMGHTPISKLLRSLSPHAPRTSTRSRRRGSPPRSSSGVAARP